MFTSDLRNLGLRHDNGMSKTQLLKVAREMRADNSGPLKKIPSEQAFRNLLQRALQEFAEQRNSACICTDYQLTYAW
jgi:hypothetical protein